MREERLTEERRELERLRRLRVAGGDGERLVEVFDQIAYVLDAHGQPDQLVGDAHFEPLVARQFEMGHARGVFGQAFHGAKRDGQTECLQIVQHIRRIHPSRTSKLSTPPAPRSPFDATASPCRPG